MSLVFAALTPHPPILVPNIGKAELATIEKTKAALEKLEEDIYIARPQVIIIISPHGSLFANSFSANAHIEFSSAFEEFGDLITKKIWVGAPELAARLSTLGKKNDIPIQLASQSQIDHGASIPLMYLTPHLPEVKILPLGDSGLGTDIHIRYGEIIKDMVMRSNQRIAVIASGDLSHCLTSDAPSPYHEAGPRFDKQINELLNVRNTAGIIGLDEALVKQAAQCGYRPLVILLGILKNINYTFKQYSYEAPFGVGYLTGNFVF